MLTNPIASKTDFLRSLAPGMSALWVVGGADITRTQKHFTAVASQLGVRITQKTAVIVSTRADEVPGQCLIIELCEDLI